MTGITTTAAGVVALDHPVGAEPRVLLVHRPGYDDWSLPKGKVHADESLPSCAVRETAEETGVRVRLEVPVGAIQYAVGSGRKEAHYWRASVIDSVRREPDGEVDKVAWVPARAALTRMSYGDERALLDRALGLPPATPFLVVRHAKAMERKNWSGRDDARPLNARGRKQADALVALLAAYGVGRLESSTATRCVQTLKPYAKASRLDTQGWSTLVEEFAEGHPKELAKLMKRLVGQAVGDQVPAAVCGHRPALPGMLESVGLQPRPMEPAAVAVAHLDAAGATVAAEFHKPLV